MKVGRVHSLTAALVTVAALIGSADSASAAGLLSSAAAPQATAAEPAQADTLEERAAVQRRAEELATEASKAFSEIMGDDRGGIALAQAAATPATESAEPATGIRG